MPLVNFVKHLFMSNKVIANKKRALLVSSAIFILVVLGLGYVPLPYSIEAQGVVKTEHSSQLYMQTSGRLLKLYVNDGDELQIGQVIAEFVDEDLATEIKITAGQQQEVQWLMRQALTQSNRDSLALEQRRSFLTERMADLLEKKQALTFISPVSGKWSAPNLTYRVGSMFSRGELVGQVVPLDGFRVIALVNQEKASDLFNVQLPEIQVKVLGSPLDMFVSHEVTFIPFQTYNLPSDALALPNGGEIFTQQDDKGKLKAKEPYFEVVAGLDHAEHSDLALYEGQLCRIRIPMPWRSAYEQVKASILQLLQKRYQI